MSCSNKLWLKRLKNTIYLYFSSTVTIRKRMAKTSTLTHTHLFKGGSSAMLYCTFIHFGGHTVDRFKKCLNWTIRAWDIQIFSLKNWPSPKITASYTYFQSCNSWSTLPGKCWKTVSSLQSHSTHYSYVFTGLIAPGSIRGRCVKLMEWIQSSKFQRTTQWQWDAIELQEHWTFLPLYNSPNYIVGPKTISLRICSRLIYTTFLQTVHLSVNRQVSKWVP